MKSTRTFTTALVVSVVFFIAAIFVLPPGFIPNETGTTLLGPITFLFGILAGFYIVVTTTDYNSFKSVVAEETAGWIRLYINTAIYSSRHARPLATLIDDYILRAFDPEIIEYVRWTQPEFRAVDHFIRKLPVNRRRPEAYDEINDAFSEIVVKRQMLTALSTQSLSRFQWAVVYILSALLIIALFGLRDGGFFADLVAVSISSAVILVLVLIRQIDLFLWNEKTFGYETYQNVLKAIGKLPYYPDQTVMSRRITITEPVYRVGEMFGRTLPTKRRKITVVDTRKPRRRHRSRT